MKKRHPDIVMCLVASGLLLLAVLAVPQRFEENDDSFMMLLSNGLYSGEISSNLVFVNSHLARPLAWLYAAVPGVDWYPGLLVAMLSVSASLFVVSVQGRGWDSLFALLALGAFGLAGILAVQFTVVAGIALVAGGWAVLAHRTWGAILIGAVLVGLAVLLRIEAAALAVAVSAPFGLAAVLAGHVALRRLVLLSAVLAGALMLHQWGEADYRAQDPAYVEFNVLRGQINDNPRASLAADRLPDGVSENDFRLFLDFFPDLGEFDPAGLRDIAERAGPGAVRISPSDWGRSAIGLLQRPDVALVMAALLLLAIGYLPSWPGLCLLIGAGVFLGGLLLVDLYAALKTRVVFTAIAAGLGAMFYLHPNQGAPWARWGRNGLLLAFTLVLVSTAAERLRENLRLRDVFLAQTALIQSWPGRVFLYKDHFAIEGARLFTDDLLALDQKIVAGGWLAKHPQNAQFSSFRDLLEEDTALFLRNDDERAAITGRILRALSENHGITAGAEAAGVSENGVLVVFRRL